MTLAEMGAAARARATALQKARAAWEAAETVAAAARVALAEATAAEAAAWEKAEAAWESERDAATRKVRS